MQSFVAIGRVTYANLDVRKPRRFLHSGVGLHVHNSTVYAFEYTHVVLFAGRGAQPKIKMSN